MKSIYTLLLAGSLVVAQAAASPGAETATESVWDDTAPYALPLDVEWGADVERDGIRMRRLVYTGSVYQGTPQRVKAIYGQPAGKGPFPAVLQIHGGGQTAYPENVAYFVKHGYACLAFDWTGPRDERPVEEVTQWSVDFSLVGYSDSDPDPRRCIIYHAVTAARRGIDVLVMQDGVDASRIGVEGVSWGGFLTWLVNAIDSRVKVAVPVYGVGGVRSQWNSMGIGLRQQPQHWIDTWTRNYDPLSFASEMHGPVMFVDGSNDFFAPLDTAEKMLGALKVPHRRAYSPNRMHSLAPEHARAAIAWIDAHLKGDGTFPTEPGIEFSAADGALTATVRADASKPITSVHVDYARGFSLPLLRGWVPADATGAGDTWTAKLTTVDATRPLYAMAQVAYADGFTMTSPVREIIPAVEFPGLIGTLTPSPVISDWGADPREWYIRTSVDLFAVENVKAVLRSAEVDGKKAILYDSPENYSSLEVSTRMTADPTRENGGSRCLEIWTHDVNSLKVRMNHFLRKPGELQYEASATPGKGWQKTVLCPAQFQRFSEDRDGVDPSLPGPTKWNELHQITLFGEREADGQVAIGLVRWVEVGSTNSN